MLLSPVLTPDARYASTTNTASEPMDTLSAPERKYAEATSSAERFVPSSGPPCPEASQDIPRPNVALEHTHEQRTIYDVLVFGLRRSERTQPPARDVCQAVDLPVIKRG